jgi:hypothetical protein
MQCARLVDRPRRPVSAGPQLCRRCHWVPATSSRNVRSLALGPGRRRRGRSWQGSRLAGTTARFLSVRQTVACGWPVSPASSRGPQLERRRAAQIRSCSLAGEQPRHPVRPRGTILQAGTRPPLLERRLRPAPPPLAGSRRRDAAASRRSTTGKTALHLSDQRATAAESETSVTVKPHPGPPLTVSLRRPTASKEARMTYLSVHNLR